MNRLMLIVYKRKYTAIQLKGYDQRLIRRCPNKISIVHDTIGIHATNIYIHGAWHNRNTRLIFTYTALGTIGIHD